VRVLYFGTYSRGEGYPRNRVLIEGLRRAGAEVFECHVEFWEDAAHKIAGATGGARRSRLVLGYAAAWVRLALRYLRAPPHDVVVVGYTGQFDVFLAKALAAMRGRPVVLDAFLSLHDTLVRDRGLVREGGALARLLRFVDRASCRVADLVLLDTRAHIRLFVELTGLAERRFARLFVGEDDRSFPPLPGPRAGDGTLRVLWFGTYVPLQGVSTVLGAAELLADSPVRFRLVGKGQEFDRHRERAEALPNVDLVPRWVDYEELNRELADADVSLGVFGTTEKASRVIPCKVYDALAVGRAVVTADTPGARELLTDGETAVLVPAGDPEALAEALRGMAADPGLAPRLARSGHRLYREKASPGALGHALVELLGALHRGGQREPLRRGPASPGQPLAELRVAD
jgi:glycosyltransferase involved in cell wall biosynthesis